MQMCKHSNGHFPRKCAQTKQIYEMVTTHRVNIALEYLTEIQKSPCSTFVQAASSLFIYIHADRVV